MIKKILGLDLGVASIGWAYVLEDENPETDTHILGMNTRIIPYNPYNTGVKGNELGQFSKGMGYATNQNRREKRGMRRNFDRYLLRRNQLIGLLNEKQMYPNNDLLIKLTAQQLWQLRANAATQSLSLPEIGRVLLHLNQKRGYKSSRKGDAKEEKAYLSKIREHDSVLVAQNKTIGQYFAEKLRIDPHFTIKKKVFSRHSYQAEFEQIWQMQYSAFPEIFTDEFKQRVGDETIYYQRKLKSQKNKVAQCRFEPTLKVAPLSSPFMGLFRIWQKIHDLRIEDKGGNMITIPFDAKKALFDALNTTDRLSTSKAFEVMGINAKKHNLMQIKELKGNATRFKIMQILGEGSPLLIFDYLGIPDEQPFFKLWHLLYSVDEPDIIVQKLQKYPYLLPQPQAEALAITTFDEGFGSLSTKAIKNILPHLEKGLDYTYSCGAAGYRHSDYLTNEENSSRILADSLEIIQKNGKDTLRNPIVEKIVNQVIHLVNDILKDPALGRPDEIRVELARSLRENADSREKMHKGNQDREKEKNNIRITLDKQFPNHRISNKIVEKHRLWHETDGLMLYETDDNKKNPPLETVLFSGEYDIEHIIPKALFFDNSFANKTLAHRTTNEAKSDQTALDFMKAKTEQALHDYTEKIQRLYKDKKISKAKRERLLMSEKDIPTDFLNRQLQETRYITSEVTRRLKAICHHVHTTTGGITDYLRHQWGLDDVLKTINRPKYEAQKLVKEWESENDKGKYKHWEIVGWSKRDDHRNHAIDAFVVACSKQSYIKQLNELHKRYPGQKALKENALSTVESLRKFPKPSKNLVQDVRNATENMLVSYKAGKKAGTWKKDKHTGKRTLVPRGALHEETIYGKQGDKYTVRYALDINFNEKKAQTILDKNIRNLVLERLLAHQNNAKEAFKDYDQNPIFWNATQGIAIRKVTCKAHLTETEYWNNNPNKPKGYVKLGNNHHVAIYRNLQGKLEEEVVSFWEAIERQKQGIPPIDTEPKDGRKFVVSLQQNEMFVVGLSKSQLQTAIEQQDYALISKHLYRVQNLSSKYYCFRLHNDANLLETKEVIELKLFLRISSLTTLENSMAIKVKLSRLGKIEKVY